MSECHVFMRDYIKYWADEQIAKLRLIKPFERRCGGDRRIMRDRRDVHQIGRRLGPADRRQS